MLPKVGLIRPATVRVRSKRLPRQDAARTAVKHSINCELVYEASAYSRLICGADDDFLLGKLAARRTGLKRLRRNFHRKRSRWQLPFRRLNYSRLSFSRFARRRAHAGQYLLL
jgi:hypothetical protein